MTQFLEHEGGQLAYDVMGRDGPLLILAPGIGDLRAAYRFLAPRLLDGGLRVAAMDLRGQGDASTGWPEYTPEAVARDMLALADHLGGGKPVVLGGSSMASASVAAAAIQAPGKVAGILMLGPWLLAPAMSGSQRTLITVGFAGPWRVRFWDTFFATLFPLRKPDDLGEYRRILREKLSEPDRIDVVRAFAAADQNAIGDRLGEVQVPALVLMGSRDPDFRDPAAQAATVADALRGTAHVLADSGHYPHADAPEETAALILEWLRVRVPALQLWATGQ